MTEEQKAEEYTRKTHCKDCMCYLQDKCNFSKNCGYYQTFIDGYHEGFKDCAKSRLNVTTISDCPIKDEWHDLEKAPTDLPKEEKQYLCLIRSWVGGEKVYACLIYDTQYLSWKESYGDVIKWKEIE